LCDRINRKIITVIIVQDVFHIMFESCFKHCHFSSNIEKADEMHFKEIFKGY